MAAMRTRSAWTGVTLPLLICLAACGLLSCAEEPLPPLRTSPFEIVAPWDVHDYEALNEALVRAHVAGSRWVVPMVYCVQFCEYDDPDERCVPYDPSPSFFARFEGDNLGVFASYHPRTRPPAGVGTLHMLIGPYWRMVGSPGIFADVGVAHAAERRHRIYTTYRARLGRDGWKVKRDDGTR